MNSENRCLVETHRETIEKSDNLIYTIGENLFSLTIFFTYLNG